MPQFSNMNIRDQKYIEYLCGFFYCKIYLPEIKQIYVELVFMLRNIQVPNKMKYMLKCILLSSEH